MVHDIGSNEETHTSVCPAQNNAKHKSGRHTPETILKKRNNNNRTDTDYLRMRCSAT